MGATTSLIRRRLIEAMLVAASAFTVATGAAFSARAEAYSPLQTRYTSSEGVSQWSEHNVRFLTGEELNRETRSTRYLVYDNYAVISFDRGDDAIIKLDGIYGCKRRFSIPCLPRYQNLRGQEQDGTQWELCMGTYC